MTTKISKVDISFLVYFWKAENWTVSIDWNTILSNIRGFEENNIPKRKGQIHLMSDNDSESLDSANYDPTTEFENSTMDDDKEWCLKMF